MAKNKRGNETTATAESAIAALRRQLSDYQLKYMAMMDKYIELQEAHIELQEEHLDRIREQVADAELDELEDEDDILEHELK